MFQVLMLAAYAALSFAATVTYNFDIGWVSCAPDGYTRPCIGINGQWPLPVIEANKGDTVVVNTHNSLGNETTSLHFHGMYQNGTAAYDGDVGVSQCPMSPGNSFTYTFTANPAGTFWYHSHDKGQYPDGLRGKMIVHDPEWEESLNIDEQIYLSMSDWYHTQTPFLIHDYLSVNNTNGDLPTPDTFLFNDSNTAPDFTFEPGKRYLLRMVSMSALACGQFHIDGHTLQVVGIDGVQVKPQNADTIVVCASQRYDVIVTGKLGATTSFKWIAKMTTDMLTHDIPSDDALSIIGTVVYSLLGQIINIIASMLTPNWTPQAVLDDMTLTPLDNTPLFSPVTRNISFKVNQTYYDGIGTRIALGSQPWTEPKVPSLYTTFSTGDAAFNETTYGPGVDPWVLKHNDIVQIYMENPSPQPHPMHLHGHEFQAVARGTGSWDGNEAVLPKVPMRRDTVVIPAQGYLVLRFRADNPGVWFFHCHIDMHLVGGMAATLIEAPEVLQQQQSIPAQGQQLCSSGGQAASGNCAAGKGGISAADASRECNTIFNTQSSNYGALVGDSAGNCKRSAVDLKGQKRAAC